MLQIFCFLHRNRTDLTSGFILNSAELLGKESFTTTKLDTG
jgi:hypothetical protein